MRIVVCVKQVPGTNKVEINEETGALKRDGVESKMNPYDLYALETAARLKADLDGTITVVSMGPPQAEAVLREAYLMGADQGYLLSDRKFAGADVLATAVTLAEGIKIIGEFDLIICGRQTTDGDTAQVGPALAEYLGIPHVTWVRSIQAADQTRIVVEQDLVDSYVVAELKYPALITVEKGIFQPRLPSYKLKQTTKEWPVQVITLNHLREADESKYGLNGSATQVERIFPPEFNTQKVLLQGEVASLTEQVYQLLRDTKYFS